MQGPASGAATSRHALLSAVARPLLAVAVSLAAGSIAAAAPPIAGAGRMAPVASPGLADGVYTLHLSLTSAAGVRDFDLPVALSRKSGSLVLSVSKGGGVTTTFASGDDSGGVFDVSGTDPSSTQRITLSGGLDATHTRASGTASLTLSSGQIAARGPFTLTGAVGLMARELPQYVPPGTASTTTTSPSLWDSFSSWFREKFSLSKP